MNAFAAITYGGVVFVNLIWESIVDPFAVLVGSLNQKDLEN